MATVGADPPQQTPQQVLLQTKLYLPPAPRRLVPRPRLMALLDRGAAGTLLLVSAPTGFGKTTVLAEWLATRTGGAVAWVALDRGDDQPATFWAYVVAALQTVLPGCRTSSPACCRSCTGGPVTGTRSTASGRPPSSTPSPGRTSTGLPTWSSWPLPRPGRPVRRPCCGAGSRPCRPRRSGTGRCSPTGTPAR